MNLGGSSALAELLGDTGEELGGSQALSTGIDTRKQK